MLKTALEFNNVIISLQFFFVVLGIELRASILLGKHFTT
jgi:hypothetical protein